MVRWECRICFSLQRTPSSLFLTAAYSQLSVSHCSLLPALCFSLQRTPSSLFLTAAYSQLSVSHCSVLPALYPFTAVQQETECIQKVEGAFIKSRAFIPQICAVTTMPNTLAQQLLNLVTIERTHIRPKRSLSQDTWSLCHGSQNVVLPNALIF